MDGRLSTSHYHEKSFNRERGFLIHDVFSTKSYQQEKQFAGPLQLSYKYHCSHICTHASWDAYQETSEMCFIDEQKRRDTELDRHSNCFNSIQSSIYSKE